MDLTTMILCAIAGFFAQILGGALGMGYGVTCSMMLMTFGIPPVFVSASINTAELFTGGFTGVLHARMGNVDQTLFRKLLVFGVIGAIFGTFILVQVPGDVLKPFIAVYLFIVGAIIIYKTINPPQPREVTTYIRRLGLLGGFCDAIGGGGWGAIVTSTLLVRGNNPRVTIGSVNAARFFVSLVTSIALLAIIPISEVAVMIIGLIIGGMLAAPMATLLCSRVAPRTLMGVAGVVILLLSVSTMVISITTYLMV
jgi:uncharacterized membrane protein YfcA